MPAAAYPYPNQSSLSNSNKSTMKSSKRFYPGPQQQQPPTVQSAFLLSENSFFLTSVDKPFDMAAEDDEQQRALQQMLWDEEFQQLLFNTNLPSSQPPANVTPLVPNPPSAQAFNDGRMAVSIYPPIPYREYPHTASTVLSPNQLSMSSAAPSLQAMPAYSPAYGPASSGYQFDETMLYSYPEQLLGSGPIIDAGFLPLGYSTSTSSPMTTEVKSETPSTASVRGEDASSYFPQYSPNSWDSTPVPQQTPRRGSHTPGPDRLSKVKTPRVSPLAESSAAAAASQAAKPRHAKRAAACWRCRKYRKPCDDEAICTSCQVGNFRVWPPAIGCRRDNLEGFALAIIPPSAEDLLRTLPADLAPLPSWRQSVLSKSLAREDLFPDSASEKWSALAIKVHATGLYGMEIVDLLNITHNYQTRQKTKNPVLESACSLFSSSCDIYNVFVISAGNHQIDQSRANIAATIQDIRNSMARVLSQFLGLCVSSKRSDWFPSVLSFAICVAALAMFMDAAVAMPAAARTELWEDVTQFCIGLRAQLYPTALDLLRIRANNDKQMAPLELTCWNWVPEKTLPSTMGGGGGGAAGKGVKLEETGDDAKPDLDQRSGPVAGGSSSSSQAALGAPQNQPLTLNNQTAPQSAAVSRMVRNPEGMRLVGNDEIAFDGFGELQRWVQANHNVLKQGKILFSNDPFTSPTVATICTLAPIFGIR